MNPHAFPILRSAGHQIPAYRWSEPGADRCCVIVIHGLGDHGQALPYRLLAEGLAAEGYGVFSYDQQGYRSVPRAYQGHANWAQLVADLHAAIEAVSLDCPGRPIALVGLSMGALLALDVARSALPAVSGVVAAAAPLGPVRASPIAIAVARFLGVILPGMPLASGIALHAIAADQALVRAYTNDPLFHTRLRAGLAKELLRAPERLRKAAASIDVPMLLLHGDMDRIAPWDSGILAQLPPTLQTVRIYAGSRHNLFLDDLRSMVFADIATWLAQLRLYHGQHGNRTTVTPG